MTTEYQVEAAALQKESQSPLVRSAELSPFNKAAQEAAMARSAETVTRRKGWNSARASNMERTLTDAWKALLVSPGGMPSSSPAKASFAPGVTKTAWAASASLQNHPDQAPTKKGVGWLVSSQMIDVSDLALKQGPASPGG